MYHLRIVIGYFFHLEVYFQLPSVSLKSAKYSTTWVHASVIVINKDIPMELH